VLALVKGTAVGWVIRKRRLHQTLQASEGSSVLLLLRSNNFDDDYLRKIGLLTIPPFVVLKNLPPVDGVWFAEMNE